jgi:hypothetical protein
MACEEKERLLLAYRTTTRLYSLAVDQLQSNRPTANKAASRDLMKLSEDARDQCETARREWSNTFFDTAARSCFTRHSTAYPVALQFYGVMPYSKSTAEIMEEAVRAATFHAKKQDQGNWRGAPETTPESIYYRKLVAIGSNPIIVDPANWPNLPNSVEVIYHLSFLLVDVLAESLRSGAVSKK